MQAAVSFFSSRVSLLSLLNSNTDPLPRPSNCSPDVQIPSNGRERRRTVGYPCSVQSFFLAFFSLLILSLRDLCGNENVFQNYLSTSGKGGRKERKGPRKKGVELQLTPSSPSSSHPPPSLRSKHGVRLPFSSQVHPKPYADPIIASFFPSEPTEDPFLFVRPTTSLSPSLPPPPPLLLLPLADPVYLYFFLQDRKDLVKNKPRTVPTDGHNLRVAQYTLCALSQVSFHLSFLPFHLPSLLDASSFTSSRMNSIRKHTC